MTKHKLDIDPSKISETFTVRPNVLKENATSIKEFSTGNSNTFVMPRIEAIHVGTTRNHTHYPADKLQGDPALKSGVYSWTHPYPKPVIYNHDIETDATGRVYSAAYSEYTSAGRPGIVVVPKITDKTAIEGIADGRLLTVSIGATTDAAICSICGTDIINEGFCGHMKGETYEGRVAEWTVGNLWFDELSWVNVPADPDAMVQVDEDSVLQAESFAFDGKDVVNLGKEKTNWVADFQTATSEGLAPTKEKGDSIVTEEEIKAIKTELEEANAERETLKAQVETLEAEKATLTTEKTTLETEKSELEVSIQEKDAAIKEKETALESVTAEKAALEEKLQEEKTAREAALSENAELSTSIHKSLVERIVDLRMEKGKESDRTEAFNRYVSRTTESLEDTLIDLQAEPAAKTRTQENVDNPSVGDVTESTKADKQITKEDVFLGLLRGPGSKAL